MIPWVLLILLPLLYFWLICPNLSRRNQMMLFNHTFFAHRGWHDNEKLIPENSMPAFKAALKENLAIELDVHLTKDNQVVVFHDDTLDRVCGVAGNIEDKTYQELSSLHLLNTDYRIPLLKDVLNYVNGRVPLLIEIKLPKKETHICQYTNELLKKYKGVYFIQSFNTLVLHWYKNHAPQVLRGQLSKNLTKKPSKEPYICRLAVRFLLVNCLGKPDFISYKLADAQNTSLFFIKHLYKTPIAVWTIKKANSFEKAKAAYNMIIFERFRK